MFERIKKSYVQGMRLAALTWRELNINVKNITHNQHTLHCFNPLGVSVLFMNELIYPTEIGVHFAFQHEEIIMQVMLTLILQQREIDPRSKLVFSFCQNRDKVECSLGVKPILLMVDSWTRYAHAKPTKPKKAKTVGSAMPRFMGSLVYFGAVEVCVDNEKVLVSGMEFFKQVRARQGFSTTVTTNCNYSKDHTSICERTIQTVRKLQKTLVMQLEEAIKSKTPQGHAVLYWAAMPSTWL